MTMSGAKKITDLTMTRDDWEFITEMPCTRCHYLLEFVGFCRFDIQNVVYDPDVRTPQCAIILQEIARQNFRRIIRENI